MRVFAVFDEQMDCLCFVLACYVGFVSVACADCEYFPSGPANLENVLKTRAVHLAQK